MSDTRETPSRGEHGSQAAPGDALELTERQLEIIDVATEVFAERGYAGSSMREIANRVGVSEPAVYRHFAGKEALFVMMVRIAGNRARRDIAGFLDEITADNVRDRFAMAMDDRRRAARQTSALLRAMVDAAVNEPAVRAEFRDVFVTPLLARLTSKAEQIDIEKHVLDADATRASRVRTLFALIVGTMVTSLALDDHPDEGVADSAMRVMGWD